MKDQIKVLRVATAIGIALTIICTPCVSLGWGHGGHMMTAQIAYQRLNPRAKKQVDTLLALPIAPISVTEKTKDFINASHWADDLRPFREFDDLKALHFIDTPFSTDGTKLTDVATPNLVTGLEESVKILKTSTDQNKRAQALRVIISFVGDIHQPLHCATMFDKEHPDGDLGGNLFSLTAAGRKTNLHSYWDGGILGFPKAGPNFAPPPLSEIGPAVALAVKGNPATDPLLKLKQPYNFAAWAEESFALAKDVAYKGIERGGSPSDEYNKKALVVVRRRVAWGGYRLAALLNAIWP